MTNAWRGRSPRAASPPCRAWATRWTSPSRISSPTCARRRRRPRRWPPFPTSVPGWKRSRSSNSDSRARWVAHLRAQALRHRRARAAAADLASRRETRAARAAPRRSRAAHAARVTRQRDRHGSSGWKHLSTRLWRENPRHRLEALCAHAAALRQRLVSAVNGELNALEQRLALAARTLNAVSPLATLGRGFAVVTRAADGALLRDAAQAPEGTRNRSAPGARPAARAGDRADRGRRCLTILLRWSWRSR